jgi:uridine kinase
LDTQDSLQELIGQTDIRYIAVEGVIGAGKTTLCTMLGETLGARVVMEQFEENPFLKDFYKDPERYAFQTQIFFLLTRYKQQRTLSQADLFPRHRLYIREGQDLRLPEPRGRGTQAVRDARGEYRA